MRPVPLQVRRISEEDKARLKQLDPKVWTTMTAVDFIFDLADRAAQEAREEDRTLEYRRSRINTAVKAYICCEAINRRAHAAFMQPRFLTACGEA